MTSDWLFLRSVLLKDCVRLNLICFSFAGRKLRPSSHRTRKQVCTQICSQILRCCRQCCVNTPIWNNVFYFLQAAFASTSACCVNGALAMRCGSYLNRPQDDQFSISCSGFRDQPVSVRQNRRLARRHKQLIGFRIEKVDQSGLSQRVVNNIVSARPDHNVGILNNGNSVYSTKNTAYRVLDFLSVPTGDWSCCQILLTSYYFTEFLFFESLFCLSATAHHHWRERFAVFSIASDVLDSFCEPTLFALRTLILCLRRRQEAKTPKWCSWLTLFLELTQSNGKLCQRQKIVWRPIHTKHQHPKNRAGFDFCIGQRNDASYINEQKLHAVHTRRWCHWRPKFRKRLVWRGLESPKTVHWRTYPCTRWESRSWRRPRWSWCSRTPSCPRWPAQCQRQWPQILRRPWTSLWRSQICEQTNGRITQPEIWPPRPTNLLSPSPCTAGRGGQVRGCDTSVGGDIHVVTCQWGWHISGVWHISGGHIHGRVSALKGLIKPEPQSAPMLLFKGNERWRCCHELATGTLGVPLRP